MLLSSKTVTWAGTGSVGMVFDMIGCSVILYISLVLLLLKTRIPVSFETTHPILMNLNTHTIHDTGLYDCDQSHSYVSLNKKKTSFIMLMARYLSNIIIFFMFWQHSARKQ